jgi:hypothetical protein
MESRSAVWSRKFVRDASEAGNSNQPGVRGARGIVLTQKLADGREIKDLRHGVSPELFYYVTVQHMDKSMARWWCIG